MKNGATSALTAFQTSGSAIAQTLEAARSQVVQRFQEGGTALLSVTDGLNRLLSSLDSVTNTLDTSEGSDAAADLRSTVNSLADLPSAGKARHDALTSLASTGYSLRKHVADMQETMRYLRTFAVTVKITGAGLPEFAGFAQEILERIYSGTEEVNGFAAHVDKLEKKVKVALTTGTNLAKSCAETVPEVASALQDEARKIAEHRQHLATMVRDVSDIARGIQGKLASTLTALQIGDVTRQRIAHVQGTFALLEDFLDGPEGGNLDADARKRLENVIHHLTAAQMSDMCKDFRRDSQTVVKTIASFDQDMQEILRLRDRMKGPGEGNVMRTLESGVSSAHEIVQQVDGATQQADQVRQSTLDTAATLLESIGNIRAVKTDIHYMALNTNLRCSRLGEAGKSINVVTAELRIFAGKLDESADAIVDGLPVLEAAAGNVTPPTDVISGGLGENLTGAVADIRATAETIENELNVLSEHGREVAGKIGLLIGKLDFQRHLGDALASCADMLEDMAGTQIADISDLADIVAPLDRKIFKRYTLAQERTVHRDIVPAIQTAAPVKRASAVAR